jgi:hypothetical protein
MADSLKVRTSVFCGIATSPAWQSWLFEFDQDLYRSFMAKLHESKGCGENRQIMMNLFEEIQQGGHEDTLVAFLQQRFPTALLSNPAPVAKVDNNIFPDYTPGVLTYPHRHIIDSGENVQQQISEFLKGKGRSDVLVKNGVAYIEYMLLEEKGMDIPVSNWLLQAWKQKHKNTQAGNK